MTAVPTQRALDSSPSTTRCTHCSLPVPLGLIESAAEKQFCCNACRLAYTAINECGLGEYYRLRRRLSSDRAPASASGKRFEEFDDSAFTSRHVSSVQDDLLTCELYLEGVHCAACVWLVERLPRVINGVVEAKLDLGRSLVRVTWAPDDVSLSRVAQGLDRLGYRPHPATQRAARDSRRRADREALVRIGVAGACAGNVMLLAAALYSGMLDGIEDSTRHAFRLLSAGIGIVAVVWPGRVFFQGAIAALRARTWHLDMPIAIALGAGIVTGVVHAIRGEGEIYFDSVTMLVFLLLFGRWLQERGVRAAADSIDLRSALTPATAHLITSDGSCRDVPSDSVEIGDEIEIRVGETSPVDGTIIAGHSRIDQAVLTGEPKPVSVSEGDAVPAGSVNTSASVRVRADAVGGDTRIGRVLDTIARLSRERLPVIGRAERVAKPFVITITALAGLCVMIWLPHGWELALEHATALLIVACPCALALATPLVTAVAIGGSARHGRLIKGADVFDRLKVCNRVFLDKTGTVTHGKFAVRLTRGDESLIAAAAAVERDILHPIAGAISELDDSFSAHDVQVTIGAGVHGEVDSRIVAVGQRDFVETTTGADCSALLSSARTAASDGLTPIYVADDQGRALLLGLGDEIRNDALDLIHGLHARGIRVSLLSGDDPESVRIVGARLGLGPEDSMGGMTPDAKLSAVESALRSGTVTMIGDGVNDAAALARSTCGIAVHGGAEASLAAADVYLTEDNLGQIETLLDESSRVVGVVKLCLAASLCYNLFAAGFSLTGLMSPLLAAILMPASSLTVILMAIGLGRSRDEVRR